VKSFRSMVGLALTSLFTLGMTAASVGAATTIDTTPSWNGSSNIFWFGETNTATYGQTFTTPADSVLNSFTFYLNNAGGGPSQFKGYVMAWDGAKAMGPVLYESGAISNSNSSLAPFSFVTGGLSLTPGQQYVAFINTSSLFDGVLDSGTMGSVDADVYSGGEFAFLNNGSNFGEVTTDNWSLGWRGAGADTAFRAEFASPTPEPTSMALLSAGTLPLLRRLRRRRKDEQTAV
jgi:hypothetical protein